MTEDLSPERASRIKARRGRIVALLLAIRRRDDEAVKRVLAEEDDPGDFAVGLAALCLHTMELLAEEVDADLQDLLRHLGLADRPDGEN